MMQVGEPFTRERLMADIIHRVGIKAPAAKVFDALASAHAAGGWWTREASGGAKVGEEMTFTFRNAGGNILGTFAIDIRELTPGKRVAWRVLDGPAEWVGTDITFDLSEQDGQTIVLFAHRRWKEPAEFMAHCSMKWAVVMLSLRELVETGTGRPSPDDVKIDNWN
jgi:uncharacterized protein YndB with AHSA1/START domain